MAHRIPREPGNTQLPTRGPIGLNDSSERSYSPGPHGINHNTRDSERFKCYYRRAQLGLIVGGGTSLELNPRKNCRKVSDGWICTNGPYSVKVSHMGAIQVKQGDWLSKYSAAIYNDFFHIHEFGRRNPDGFVFPVDDVDRIFVGETLYHLPTYYQHVGKVPRYPKSSYVPDRNLKISDEEKKKRVLDILSKEYKLSGDRLRILSKTIDIIGNVDDAITLAGIAGIISESGVIASIGTVAGLASILGFPVGGMIAIINANEIGQRTYGFRAIAYTITAYAFGERPPDKSFTIRERIDRGGADAAELAAYDKAWKDAKNSTLKNLEQTVLERRVSRISYRAYLRACGDDNKQKLCKVLLKGFEGELKTANSAVRDTWKQNYKVEYSN